MAKKPTRSKVSEAVEDIITEEELSAYTAQCLKTYGSYTLEWRAIPAMQDGLKPVHRRILFAAAELGLYPEAKVFKKSARIIGDVLGKFHPHGDSAAYEAMCGMVRAPIQLIEGSGNFGTLTEPEAAMRYTEARLSWYASQVLLNKWYTPTMDYIPNFDGSEREPITLPSLLPTLLVNGYYGITLGTTASMPAYELEGVIELTKLALSGKTITPKLAHKYLVPTCADGGWVYTGEEDGDEETFELYRSVLETGRGSLYWVPEYEIDVDARTLTLTGFPPSVGGGRVETNMAKAINAYPKEISEFRDLSDLEDGHIRFVCTLKKTVDRKHVEEILTDIVGCFEGSQGCVFAITDRNPSTVHEDEAQVDFSYTNITDFFNRWVVYRTELERKAIAYWQAQTEKKLAREEMMLLAVLNRAIILKSLDEDDSAAYITKATKGVITLEQAKEILELKVRQLKALEEKGIRANIKTLKAEIIGYKADYKNPTKRMLDRTNELAASLLSE